MATDGAQEHDGGLGLTPPARMVVSPAFIAGVVAAYSFLPEALQNDLKGEKGTSDFVQSFREEVTSYLISQ